MLVWHQAGHLACKKGCWFVDGDNFTGGLHVFSLLLSPPLPSSLAAIKPANPGSHGKVAVKMERERVIVAVVELYATRGNVHVQLCISG